MQMVAQLTNSINFSLDMDVKEEKPTILVPARSTADIPIQFMPTALGGNGHNATGKTYIFYLIFNSDNFFCCISDICSISLFPYFNICTIHCPWGISQIFFKYSVKITWQNIFLCLKCI